MSSGTLLTKRPSGNRLPPNEAAGVAARCRELRELREARGILQATVIDALGTDRCAVWKVEQGLVDPLLSTYLGIRTLVLEQDLARLTRMGARRLSLLQAAEWADRARAAREKRGLSLTDFAVVGVSKRQLIRVENGECIPHLSTAMKVGWLVGVDV